MLRALRSLELEKLLEIAGYMRISTLDYNK